MIKINIYRYIFHERGFNDIYYDDTFIICIVS